MQAHPLSSPAARISSSSRPTLSHPSRPSSAPASSRVLRTEPLTPTPDSPTPSVADSVGLAHDAGNLLAALGLYCDLLSVPGVLRPEHQHYATELSLISDRSSTLIQRLIIPTSATVPAKTPRSPLSNPRSDLSAQSETASDAANHASVLRHLAPVLQRIAAGTARVTVICPASLPPLDFTSDILERIVVNLVRNSAEAIRLQRCTADSPPHIYRCGIRVSLNLISLNPVSLNFVSLNPASPNPVSPNPAASQLQLTVEDDGTGMPPAVAAEFLRPSPLPQGATHGLGHRIVHELATATGGQLAIRVLPGKGTIVSVLWPVPAALLPCSNCLNTSSVDSPGSPSTQSPATTSQGPATC